MFDHITQVPEVKCRGCGKPLNPNGWQSKDGPCYLLQLPFWEVRNFYNYCETEYCGEWHKFTLKAPQPVRPITDYKLESSR